MTLVYSLDVSNYQPVDLGPLIAHHKPQHVAIRLSTESQQHVDITRQQLATALSAGCSVSGIIWAYFDLSPVEHVAHALSVADGFPVDLAWFDCEGDSADGQLDNWLSQAVALVENRKKRAGIYTGAGWWRANGDSQGFGRLPLWVSDWTGLATLDPPSLGWFGGWTTLAGRQWDGGDNGTGLDHVGRDVFDAAVISTPDPCTKLRADIAALIATKPYRAPSKTKLKTLIS